MSAPSKSDKSSILRTKPQGIPQGIPRAIPVILAGGNGTRLWPISRIKYPKPFISLGDETLFQQALRRAIGLGNISTIVIVANHEYQYFIDHALQSLPSAQSIEVICIQEPLRRDTAAAIGIAAMVIKQRFGEDIPMVTIAADHVISEQSLFNRAVNQAIKAANSGYLATIGVIPRHAEIAYGYIHMGEHIDLEDTPDMYQARSFVEKPDLDRAQIYLDDKQHLWNCSLFCFSPKEILRAIEQYAKPISKPLQALAQSSDFSGKIIKLDAQGFKNIPQISIDYAVMEQATNVCTIKTNMEWRDIGSWNAVHEFLPKDNDDNVSSGNVKLTDTKSSMIMAQPREGAVRKINIVGMENIVVVDTPDALLVTTRDHAQTIKDVAQNLQNESCITALEHVTNYRPWGHYTILDEGPNHKVKRLTINPEQGISLQMHHHRAEHWVIVQGQALIINGDGDEFVLETNQSTYISAGHRHRVRNPSQSMPLIIAEVQTGNYLGEDDIIRFDDIYGRK